MMQEHHTAASACEGDARRCSRCGVTKPPTGFYRNPASICKDCHNRASRLTNQIRRAAVAHLIATHQDEYLASLQAERVARAVGESGGGSDAA